MAKPEEKVDQMLEILCAIGVPVDSLTKRRRQRMAEATLAVANIKPDSPWSEAACWDPQSPRSLRSRDIIAYLNDSYGEDISRGSYDDIRRKDLKLPVASGLVLPSAGHPNATTNDPTRGYAIAPEAVAVLREYGKSNWDSAVQRFKEQFGELKNRLVPPRPPVNVPAKLPDGAAIVKEPGPHGQLMNDVIQKFLPRFVPGADVLYVGGTRRKTLCIDKNRLAKLGLPPMLHDKLPDVVAEDTWHKWLILVEVVHSSNPVSELRHLDLRQMAKDCPLPVVYVSAFADRASFRKFSADISWETEVWVADTPDHMIHYNGERYLGPYPSPGPDDLNCPGTGDRSPSA